MNFNVKIFSCALMLALSSANLDAAETGPAAMQKDSSCNAGQFKCERGDYSPVGRSDRYGVSLMGMYGWNTTWGHYGGAAVGAHLPIVRFFEADADLECHSAGVFSGGISLRPLFPISEKGGTVFLDCSLFYRDLYKYSSSEFVTAVSAGYRWDYLGIQVGFANRQHIDNELQWNSNSDNVAEPFDAIYKAWFKVRPASSVWNLGAGLTNFSPYEYERMWQPMVFIDAHWDVADHFRLLAEVYLKQSGSFHLTAGSYGVIARLGLEYRF